MELNDIIDLVLDFMDNIMPGIISLFSGAVVTTKNKVRKFNIGIFSEIHLYLKSLLY